MLRKAAITASVLVVLLTTRSAPAGQLRLRLGPEQIVQANGADLVVPGYSVPSLADWNNDGLMDLVVGQGGGADPPGKIRIYINEGDDWQPVFNSYFFAASNGVDLEFAASGCLGCFPRVIDYNGDLRKDLLVGLPNGRVQVFLNTATDESPDFGSGSMLMVGQALDIEMSVIYRATPCFVDWNNDGRKDIVSGAYNSKIHLYLNGGDGDGLPPDFSGCSNSGAFAQTSGGALVVPGNRSSPEVMDLDDDGKKDILAGNTDGQLFFYSNIGTDAAPLFDAYELVTSEGVAIDLVGLPRSRPSVCDWTADGYPDVLIGAGDGLVHLYESVGIAGDVDKDYDLDFDDLSAMGYYWLEGADGYRNADLNHDGGVDFLDFAVLVEAYSDYADQ